jgi:hypothetical protein
MRAREISVTSLPAVATKLSYLAPMAETPFTYSYGPPAGQPRTNAVYDEHTVTVQSMRPIADHLSLDREGVALVEEKSAVADFYDADELKRVYYPEIEALVKQLTGAHRVLVFDHTVRRRSWEAQERTPSERRLPVMRVHNDYTEASGPQRVKDLMGGEAEALLQRRFAFLNVWRPIRGPLLDQPLALCDATSAAPADFVRSEQRYEGRTGEIYVMRHSPRHRWLYAPAMSRDEALVFKCYDSMRDIARFTAHTAFDDPTTPADAPPRESIEMRTIAFFA